MDVKNRASVVPGSYTDGNQLMQIANADVFFFKWIFHDNSDTVCRMILKGLFQIMKPTAMIIICDNVLKPTLNEWKFPILLDLTMAQILNAKQRTKNEWTQLLSNGESYQYNVSFGDYTIDEQFLDLDLITLTKKI